MSSADLDYIRTLLVAQTADAEPKAKGLLGRLFSTKAESPHRQPLQPPPVTILDLNAPAQAHVQGGGDPGAGSDQELLLKQICASRTAIESASLLAPPTPRAKFGRRPNIAPEPELVLDKPATVARRLQLLDPFGQPVGEMILHPDEPPPRVIASLVREEVPYFPEDFLDPGQPSEPQPLRPWLKALRTSGRAQPGRPIGAAASEGGAPLTKGVRERRGKGRQLPPQAKSPSRPLGHDLLEALAFSLAREQENLADRLLSVVDDSVFRQAMAESASD